LRKEEAQSLKEIVEKEVEMAPPYKSKKKKGKDGVGLSKAQVQEMIPSPVAQSKRGIEASVGSPIKKLPTIPKKGKGEENVHEPSKELLVHVDLHSLMEESNGEGDSLPIPLN
jgi:hypothetical protein